MIRTRVYVDAFNLYYGCLRGTPFKWLDLDALCRNLLQPTNAIDHIHYCTALVSARINDPGQPQRQQLYLRALGTIPHLTVTYGRFLTSDATMPLAPPGPNALRKVVVRKTEEKGSDVNLATMLLKDGFRDLYVEVVKTELGKPVGVLNPHPNQSFHLHRCATFY
jgi:hypothetical protein